MTRDPYGVMLVSETSEGKVVALPDIDGKPRKLSELRGKKVFLATWASW